MNLLTLDTSTDLLSCCVTNKDTMISEISIRNLRNHSIKSMDVVDYCLINSNLKVQDIDCFIISKGPGSFTGLRIAFSIIKAFCFSLKKPMISISSLDAIAFKEHFNGITCSILDALREEIYINSYENKNDILNNTNSGDIIKISDIKQYIKNKHENFNDILFSGDCINKNKEILLNNFKNAKTISYSLSAFDYALLGYEKFKLKKFDDLNSSVPSYIRVSQAQEMLMKNKLTKND